MTSKQRISHLHCLLRYHRIVSSLLCAGRDRDCDPGLSDPSRDLSRQPLRYRRPNLPPPRTAIAAALLLLGGVVFLSLGLSVFYASLDLGGTGKDGDGPKDRGTALLVLGGISKCISRSANSYAPYLCSCYCMGACLFVFACSTALIVCFLSVFIPGSYASTVLWGAWRGWDGYDYAQVPSYDD